MRRHGRRTAVGRIPSIEGELQISVDGDDGGQRQLRVRVGRQVHHGRVGQELHRHAHVLGHRAEHQRRLRSVDKQTNKLSAAKLAISVSF